MMSLTADAAALTDSERSLFEHLRTDPEATLQDLADAIGSKR